MMKREKRLFSFLFVCLLLITLKQNSCEAGCAKLRCLSIRALQNELNAVRPGENPSPDILRFAEMTFIKGYVTDTDNRDLIIIGNREPDLPPVDLENFVVALRSAWNYYEPYGNPICSIDPDPAIIQKLLKTGNSILSSETPEQAEVRLNEWHRVCGSPQNVRVSGIPFYSQFASIMVKADYDMKKIVDGSDTLEIPNLQSLSDMALEKIREDFSPGKPLPFSLSMNRFWFYPGENSYDEDEGVVLIRNCPVTLLTEEAYGNMEFGTGKQNPLAQKFAENFTACYDEVAKKRAIYSQLQNLFRFVALAKIIKYKSSDSEAGLNLSYLLENYSVKKNDVANQLPGRSNVKRLRLEGDLWEAYFWLPSCGGVDMDIPVKRELFKKGIRKGLSFLKWGIIRSKPSPDAIYWDYSYSFDNYIDEFGEDEVLKRINTSNKTCQVYTIDYTPSGFIARNGEMNLPYEHDEEAAFLNAISKNLQGTGNKTVYLYTKNFPNTLKTDVFKKMIEIQQASRNTNFTFKIIDDMHQLQDYFLSKFESIESESAENVNEKGMVTLKVILRHGAELARIAIRVIAKTIELANEFVTHLKTRLNLKDAVTKTLADMVNEVYLDMKIKYNLQENELIIEIEDECEGINFSVLKIKLMKDKA
jgi:hypothetical protein